jgi:hypothetical protein
MEKETNLTDLIKDITTYFCYSGGNSGSMVLPRVLAVKNIDRMKKINPKKYTFSNDPIINL